MRVGGSEGNSAKKSSSDSSIDKKIEELGRGSESDSVMTGGSNNGNNTG
jgi:hypothetical protein